MEICEKTKCKNTRPVFEQGFGRFIGMKCKLIKEGCLACPRTNSGCRIPPDCPHKTAHILNDNLRKCPVSKCKFLKD